jgi:anthranilate/para-aminobenzoate synthase component I
MRTASYDSKPREFQLRVLTSVEAAPSPLALLKALPRGCRPLLLHDATGGPSLLAWNPDRIVEGSMLPAPHSVVPDSSGARPWPFAAEDPAQLLAAAWQHEDWDSSGIGGGLGPGWIGWFGWSCAHAYERWPWLPRNRHGLPDWSFGRFRTVIRCAADGSAELLHADRADADGEAALRAEFIALCERATANPPAQADVPRLEPRDRGENFRASVAQVRAWIGSGDLYQANLSHELSGEFSGNPRALFAQLAARQPTRMSAYWEDAAGRALLSQSPESFLTVHGPLLATRPIKGTAARHTDPAADADSARALDASAKERAELAMIVDMARNDLGRIALPGGVEVASPGEVESFPSLHHRTATVCARWQPAQGFARLWAAVFPPASVSGAPKVRALQAIAELEGEDRGPYCGALGWWRPGAQPSGDFSVLIRTAIAAHGRLSLRVGAGIVWDSDPEREWRETLLKARYLEAAAAPGIL